MRHIGLVRGQHVDLLLAVHRVPQVQARTQFEVTLLEHAFEQQDGAAPTERAHALRLVQVEQGKAIGAAQAFIGAFDAVAIGIGLDDGPDARLRCSATCARQVVGEGFGMDAGLDRTGHGVMAVAAGVRILTSRDVL